MLVSRDSDYEAELIGLAHRHATGRVFFHPAVKPSEIVQTISQYDLGFYLLPQTSFNNEAALPNKFFDFLAAGLGTVVGPSPAMAQIIHTYGSGVVCPSIVPSDVADTLNLLTRVHIEELRRNAQAAARDINADVEMSRLIAIYARILDPSVPSLN